MEKKNVRPKCPRCNGFLHKRFGLFLECGAQEDYVSCVHCGFRIEHGESFEDALERVKKMRERQKAESIDIYSVIEDDDDDDWDTEDSECSCA